ncbi:MAG: hypothetical protein V4735_07325 [Pseudomonadota bacterium]
MPLQNGTSESTLLSQSNPLKGVFSDAAAKEVVRLIGSLQKSADVDRVMPKVARVFAADLDGADGKFDHKIHASTLENKLKGVFGQLGVDPAMVKERMKGISGKDFVSSQDVEAAVVGQLKEVGHMVVAMQQALKVERPTLISPPADVKEQKSLPPLPPLSGKKKLLVE